MNTTVTAPIEKETVPAPLTLAQLLEKINANPEMKLEDRMALASHLTIEARMYLNRKIDYVNHEEKANRSRNGIFIAPTKDGRLALKVIPTNNIIMLGADDFVFALCGARILYSPR